MARDRLRVYLGAAPGVGKTHAMLEEGIRRAGRGADVMVGILDDTGRHGISALAAGLPHAPTLVGHDGGAELDVTVLCQRHPTVVLVDNIAHRVDEHRGRWDAVEELLTDGIDVITTVNISSRGTQPETLRLVCRIPVSPCAMVRNAHRDSAPTL